MLRDHRHFVLGLATGTAAPHDALWPESLAVGSAAYGEPVHAEIEIRIRGRRVKHRSGVSLSRSLRGLRGRFMTEKRASKGQMGMVTR